jgi:hypothetical protein
MAPRQKRPARCWRRAIVLPLLLSLLLSLSRVYRLSGADAGYEADLDRKACLPLTPLIAQPVVPDGHRYSFPLALRTEPPFTFAVMADTHSGIDEDAHPVLRREVDSYHRNAVARIRSIHPPFYMVVGDLVHVGSDLAAWYSFREIEGDLMAESTIYPALGNHEGLHQNYFSFFDLPNNERWYSWDYGNAHFIVLEIDGYARVDPGSPQYRWLVKDLSRTDKTWKFFFFHFPLYSCGLVAGPDLEARSALHPLFLQYGVDIVFSGHDHNYQRHVVHGITYMVTGGGGMETWGLRSGCYGDPWPVYWEETRHVVEVVVSGNTVTSTAIRPDGSRFDQFSLTAG